MEYVLALPPPTNEAFLREVNEELRRDQAAQFWTRYGRWLIVAVLGGLALFAGVLFWQNRQQELAGEQGRLLTLALEKLGAGDEKSATPTLSDLSISGVSGYRVTAKFVEADILLQKNDLKGAAAKFAEVVNDTSVGQPFRDLALIRQTSAEYDTLKPETVIARLKPFAIKDNAWFGSAGEMVAVAQLRLKETAAAGRLFADIAAEQSVPESIRQRAVQMAGTLGVDAIRQNEEKKAR